jgi:hypothetical protein
MSRGLNAARPVGRFSLLIALSAGLLTAAGCEDCGGEPPDGTQDPYLILSTPAGTQLEADGASTLPLSVVAFNTEGVVDNTPITVTTSLGEFLSDSGTLSNANQTLVLTPADAPVEFSFRCPGPPATGEASITATNGPVSFSTTMNCIEPRGQVTLRVEDAPCAQLTADGDSNCPITAYVELASVSGESIAQRGVPLTAEIIGARLLNDPSQTEVEGAERRLLSAGGGSDAGPANTEERVTGATGDSGDWTFYLHSVTLAQELEVQIQVTGTAADGTALDLVDTIVINPFDNRASVDIATNTTAVSANQAVDLAITATDANGNPASGETVTVNIPSGSGATIESGGVGPEPDTLEVTLDAAGAATVVFTAPGNVVDPFEIPVTAEYQPDETLPVITAVQDMRIFPENALLVNVALDDPELKSDENEVRTITVTVTRFDNGTVSPQSGANVTFSVSQSDIERLILGTRATDPAVVDQSNFESQTPVATDVDGEATQQISSRNSRSRGRAAIDIRVEDQGDEATATIEVDLVRDPILQSIVFVSSVPDEIGVRGGAYPSASELTFRILDDLNDPMANVSVTFDTNATADPASSVVQQGLTDESGTVSTVLSAGTQAGPISVVAIARFNGVTLVAESEPVPVTGGLPSFSNSYLICDDETRIQEAPFEASCTAVLGDRFTNRVPAGLPVQFRVEGGNVNAVDTTLDGAVQAVVLTGAPGPGTAALVSSALSVTGVLDSWSYGNVVPLSPIELATGPDFVTAQRDGCFDGTTNTSCNTYALCRDAEANTAANTVMCPLPFDAYDGEGCWNKLEAAAITGSAADLSAAFKTQLGLGDVAIQALLDTKLTPQVYYGETDADADAIRAIVDAHLANMGRCGPITACLTGQKNGVPFIYGDECPLNMGCYDFDPATKCPHDSLLTVTAIARGEEGFSDLNGNGILDYDDANGNGRHDPGELLTEAPGLTADDFDDVVVDMPEPFLDKDDNCFADDHGGSLRLTTYDAIRLSDQYSDEDGSGGYGYLDATSATGEPTLANGQWDRDKQIFLSDHLVALSGGPQLDLGVACPSSAVGGDWTDPVTSLTCACEDRGNGLGIARGCVPDLASGVTLSAGDQIRLVSMWTDTNGVCYSPGTGYSMDSGFYSGDLNVSGHIALEPIDRAFCGINKAQFPRREWCATETALGSQYAEIDVLVTCDYPFFDRGEIAFHLHEGPKTSADIIAIETLKLNTNCPYCGDGVITAPDETCEPAIDGATCDPTTCTFIVP